MYVGNCAKNIMLQGYMSYSRSVCEASRTMIISYNIHI